MLDADEDDADEDDDDEEGSRESLPKRRKLVDPAERVMRRREKRLWHEKRKEILFSYMQFSFYSSSVILVYFFPKFYPTFYLFIILLLDGSFDVWTGLETISR